MCGQPAFVFQDFCLIQGIDFINFCLPEPAHMFYELIMYTMYLAQRAPHDSVDHAVNGFVIKKERVLVLFYYHLTQAMVLG